MDIRERIEALREMERVATRDWQSCPSGVMYLRPDDGGWIEYHGAAKPTVLTDRNAEFIATMRNSLKELLDLAKLAVEARELARGNQRGQGPYFMQSWAEKFDALAQEARRGS